uniref:VOC domain-containing protein n=1 Tax=Araucaria cunninghamii TaxID=56994 RepID=A0A0D6QZB5_ARACU
MNCFKISMGNADVAIPVPDPLPLLSLDHVSLVCKSVKSSTEFYAKILGFHLVKRPSSFHFEGAWLYNYGVGIHLLKCESDEVVPLKSKINPRDNHVSFQCTDVGLVEKKLQQMKIKYEKRVVEEGGIYVDQIFFHDPDGYMIEICNCENLPIVPLKEKEGGTRGPSCVNRSKSLHYALPKSAYKMERPKSYSEISLVPANEKEAKPTIEERRCSSEAHKDQKPLLLDIMNFYI